MIAAAAFALVLAPPFGPQYFVVSAAFEAAPKPGKSAAVAVTFSGTDVDVHINEEPAPRLRLEPTQTVLLDKQPPPSGSGPDFDPDTARYLDLAKPVRFPVAIAPEAPKGEHPVKATVVYFYCSKREAWCRRGTAEIEIAVPVK
jgi:hypothetical protein